MTLRPPPQVHYHPLSAALHILKTKQEAATGGFFSLVLENWVGGVRWVERWQIKDPCCTSFVIRLQKPIKSIGCTAVGQPVFLTLLSNAGSPHLMTTTGSSNSVTKWGIIWLTQTYNFTSAAVIKHWSLRTTSYNYNFLLMTSLLSLSEASNEAHK